MEKIDYKIIKGEKNMWEIRFPVQEYALITSLQKSHFRGAIVSSDYKSLKFKAESIQSYADFRSNYVGKLPLILAAKLVAGLAQQLDAIQQATRHTIIGFTPEHVIVINGTTFAYLGCEFVSKIEGEHVTICSPFNVYDFFAAPELVKITELPSTAHYRAAYFSIACFSLYAICNDKTFYQNYLMNQASNLRDIYNCLNNLSFKNTKLYWLLSRCLDEQPENRSIYFI